MPMLRILLVAATLAVALVSADDQYEGFYCGEENCYDVLGVEQDATANQIRRSYRKLAKVMHPDKKPASEKKEAEKAFRRISTAYEILKDEDSRNNYDYMLAHPEEYYENMYRYYKHKAAPKVDVLPIIIVLLSVISAFQYFHQHTKNSKVVRLAMQDQKFRMRAKNLAIERGLIKKKQSKKEIEEIIRQVVTENIDMRGENAPASVRDTAWVQLLMSPYYIVKNIAWYASWTYRIKMCHQEYNDEDKEYLIRKNLGFSAAQWELEPESVHEMAWRRELWDPENYEVYETEEDEKRRARVSRSGKYKQEKRMSRKGFAPENMLD